MVLEGNDGDSPLPVSPYLDKLSKTPIGINFGTFAGQGSGCLGWSMGLG